VQYLLVEFSFLLLQEPNMFLLPVMIAAALSISFTKTEVGEITKAETAVAVNSLNKTLLLQLVNNARTKGCRCGDNYYPATTVLTWNDQLEKAAAEHSNDMFKKKYFSHIASNGANGGIRIEKAGYDWLAYGENIGYGYKSENEVVEAWLKSPGHCKNIMDKKYKEMGVARSGYYWTQTFGSK
jgi:uncharacterized protein YkwD